MEHDARKMTALVLLLLLLGAGVVGVGYAAFSGQASTYNEGNSATAGYLYLDNKTSEDWAPIMNTSEVEMNTYNYHEGSPSVDYAAIYYTGSDQLVDGATYHIAALKTTTGGDVSKTFKLTNQTGADITAIDFTATAVANSTVFSALDDSDFKYIMKVKVGTDGGEFWRVVDNDMTVGQNLAIGTAAPTLSDTGSVDITVSMYIGYDITGVKYIPDTFVGPAVAGTPPVSEHAQAAYVIEKDKLGTDGPVDVVAGTLSFAFTAKEYTA